jgi:glycosyltransferase involved in cell wall biosynthesis
MDNTKKIAIISRYSLFGGVSKVIKNLAVEFARKDIQVDLLLGGGDNPFADLLHNNIKVIDFNTKHSYTSLFYLILYIINNNPDVLFAIKHKPINIAIIAHLLSPNRRKRHLSIRIAGHISSSIQNKSSIQKFFHLLPIKSVYSKADSIITVSKEVQTDLQRILKNKVANICTLPNPSIPSNIESLASQECNIPWLKQREKPVIIGIGRFTPRKDFTTLIRAFSLVLSSMDCRLVLLGEGQEMENYIQVARQLHVESRVAFPGFVPNPYPCISRSDVLVLSSNAAEGSPNVLKEALALGTPVVATDCPSGPREILDGGRYGRLVPVADPESMAEAIVETLNNPPDPDVLRSAVQRYSVASSAGEYLSALGIQA